MSDSLNNVHEQFAELQAKVEELTAALEYVAGPMMLGDEPTMGYHCRAIAYIEAALKESEGE